MSAFLLTTKLNSPQLRHNLVPRAHIAQSLNTHLAQRDGFARQLTLVSASAGFGKTTLVAEWLRHVPQPVTWLTLDEHDNDPARFLAYLLAALQHIDARIGQSAQALLAAPQPPTPDSVLASVINEIVQVARPFFLVLDDYHKIQNRSIHEQLSYILEHQPSTLHLVIITREDPLLPISRLRARNQLVELRQADLRFGASEIAEFFRRTVGLDLPPAVVAMLEDRTEGWVAGLQLAALSLHHQTDVEDFVRSLAGSNRYILDYLFDEVLSQQTAEVQAFLLATSILDRLSGSLCDAVAQHSGSAELLQSLESANLFLIPLDSTRTWYRYHHLFAELLRHRLRLTGGSTTVELHARASQWFEAENQPFDALQHALAGRAWARAAGLIGQLATMMLRQGQVTTLLGWLQALPADLVQTRPALCFAMAWTLLLTGQLNQAERYLTCAAKLAEDDAQARGDLLVAQAYLARARGEHEQAISYAQEALQVLPTTDAMARGMVALSLGMAQAARGHLAEAESALNEAYAAAQANQNHYGALTALSLLGSMQFAYGHLHQAAEICRQVLSAGHQLPPTAMAHAVMGALHYEWNNLHAAADHLTHGVELCQVSGNADVMIDCLVSLARVQVTQRRYTAARASLERAQDLVDQKNVAPMMPGKVAAGWANLALAEGDIASAHFWASRTTSSSGLSLIHARDQLVPVYLLVAQGEYAQAAAALERLWEWTTRTGLVYVRTDVRVLQALTAPSRTAAMLFLHEALALAEPEGYVRTFVDKDAALVKLLRTLPPSDPFSHYVNILLAACATGSDRARDLPADAPIPAVHTVASALAEPLTGRELEILKLLADGSSNEQIGDQLFITVGTVKTHLHRIYGKLDVQNRTQAVARARTLHLL